MTKYYYLTRKPKKRIKYLEVLVLLLTFIFYISVPRKGLSFIFFSLNNLFNVNLITDKSSKNQFITQQKKSQLCFTSAIFSLNNYLNSLILYFQFDVGCILI